MAALVYQVMLAQDRAGFNEERDPKLQPALIETCAEIYRCTECTVPFHRKCAEVRGRAR